MPLYYFNLFNDETTIDEEGQELADLPAARRRAIQEARVLACESVRRGHLNLDDRVEVLDAQGVAVLVVTFREAVAIESGRVARH